jgi:hypothetical protein
MGQCRDGVQSFGPLDLLSHRVGEHAPVAHKDDFFQAVLLLQLGDLARHGRGILGVAGKNFDSHRTAFRAAEQGDDHLFVTPFAVAIVAEGDDVALSVNPFKIAAGNIIEH